MNIVEFNPLGKKFLFYWDDYTCHRCKYGNCPLDALTLDEIKNLEAPKQTPDEYSWGYCVRLASHYFKYVDRLKDTFCDGISIVYNEDCGHYDFIDGRHRTCVIAHILQKGSKTTMYADLNVNHNWKCRQCSRNESNENLKKKLTWFDKVFKTKRYRNAVLNYNPEKGFVFFDEPD